jgi:hypothetical protein
VRVTYCRQSFLDEMASATGDPVKAALHLASEDDAFVSRSTVELPVPAFSKRLDDCVAAARNSGKLLAAAQHKPQKALDTFAAYLFGELGYWPAQKMLELYSPYRIYMHKVRALSTCLWQEGELPVHRSTSAAGDLAIAMPFANCASTCAMPESVSCAPIDCWVV